MKHRLFSLLSLNLSEFPLMSPSTCCFGNSGFDRKLCHAQGVEKLYVSVLKLLIRRGIPVFVS